MLSEAHEGDGPEVPVATVGAGQGSPWPWCCFGGLRECRRGSLWGQQDRWQGGTLKLGGWSLAGAGAAPGQVGGPFGLGGAGPEPPVESRPGSG